MSVSKCVGECGKIFGIISVRRPTLTVALVKPGVAPRVIAPLGALQVPAGQWLAAKVRLPAKIRYTVARNASTRKYSGRVAAERLPITAADGH